jgi:hypothetical protein
MFTKHENNKRRLVKQLKEVKKNADKGVLTHSDYRTLTTILIKLTEEVYDILNEKEEK